MSGMSKTEYAFVETTREISKRIHENAKGHGFWELEEKLIKAAHDCGSEELAMFATQAIIALKLSLIHSEISEGLEGIRKKLMDDKLPSKEMLDVELGDASIRIMDLAHWLRYDLGETVIAKHTFNKGRPYKHGKEF